MTTKGTKQPIGRLAMLQSMILLIAFLAAEQRVFAEEPAREKSPEAVLKHTRQEYDDQLETMQQEETRLKYELAEQLVNRRQLTDQIVDIKLASAKANRHLEQLQTHVQILDVQVKDARQAVTEMEAMGRLAANELEEMLETLPATEKQPFYLSSLGILRQDAAAPETVFQKMACLLDLVLNLLAQSSTTDVRKSSVRNAAGYVKEVETLRVGHVLYAYVDPASGETAIAVANENDPGQRRWKTDLSRHAQKKLGHLLMDGTAAEGLIWVPVDISCAMTAETGGSNHTLADRLKAGGMVMVPLLLVALAAICLLAERAFVLIRLGRSSRRLILRVMETCQEGRFSEAEGLLRKERNLVSSVLAVCLQNCWQPVEILEDAIERQMMDEQPKLERFLSTIAILAAVAPMLGLLGTVTGIITTFDVISVFGSGKPALMAKGISEALMTTAAGLVIAIPVLLAHNFIAGWVDRIIAETEKAAASIVLMVKQQHHCGQADYSLPERA